MSIELRVVASAADFETWARIKTVVTPDEPVTAAQLEAQHEDGRLLLLASLDGADAGCGVSAPSSFAARGFLAARVLPQHRRRGVGRELVRALADHARALGRTGVNAFVDAADPGSLAFARGYGLAEVDYQLEQVRAVGDEPAPAPVEGVELLALDGRRDEFLRAAWPLALEAYADMPLPGEATFRLETWLREEATCPDGSFVALEAGEIVGYAGLMDRAEPGTAEHGLTAVRRDRRHRGIARALKRAQLRWASRNGVHQLVTWTQRGNEAMQALNRSLGYADRSRVLTMQGPLPV